MNRRIQFSLRGMLGAIGLFCVDAWLFSVFPEIGLFGRFLLLGLPIASVAGAAFGFFMGRPLLGAAFGAGFYYAVLLAMLCASVLLSAIFPAVQ